MGATARTQSIRRSTRLPLEVPLLVTSLDGQQSFSEQGSTTLVNAHGCGVIVPRALSRGLPVRLEIVSAKRQAKAHVAEAVPLGGEPETWLVGLELEVPGNFWGIEYAPSDWKVEESSLHGAGGRKERDEESIPVAKPDPPRRWRLTDISQGACYLETATPFASDTPVLLSIRADGIECLLDGVVRVSHPQIGMGVEFQRPDKGEQHTPIEELIDRLANNREVPRIFVGRKERKHAASNDAPSAALASGLADPLRDLIRAGAPLTVEQFLHSLRAQRLRSSGDLSISNS